jgi:EAL domain-containing protein (putative c-di-GMP-specific phosphodiesterase class I)
MHATAAAEALGSLRSLGVHISIDDFGTGWSSLSYLKRFPVSALKIDRTFIAGLGTDVEDTSIVEAIVTLAHALGLTAVAEGLETPTQLETLRVIGCDHAQGYLLGRPLPAELIGDNPADDLTAWFAPAQP